MESLWTVTDRGYRVTIVPDVAAVLDLTGIGHSLTDAGGAASRRQLEISLRENRITRLYPIQPDGAGASDWQFKVERHDWPPATV